MPSVLPLDADLARALGTRLKDLREASGLNQEQVAYRAGISRNHLQLLEKGLSDRVSRKPANPHISVLVSLCSAVGVGFDAIVDIFPSPRASVEYID